MESMRKTQREDLIKKNRQSLTSQTTKIDYPIPEDYESEMTDCLGMFQALNGLLQNLIDQQHEQTF